jgi:hypothetical protein
MDLLQLQLTPRHRGRAISLLPAIRLHRCESNGGQTDFDLELAFGGVGD